MQIATGTVSHRSIHQATKMIIKDVIGDINGTPDFLLVAYTPNYRERSDYEHVLQKIAEESGTSNIIGGNFPAVATSDGYPTTQGCSIMAMKSSEVTVDTPFSFSNIRTHYKEGAKKFAKKILANNHESKIGFFLTPGPFYPPGSTADLQVLDTFFAHKFKGMFNAIGRIINKNMGKNGFGGTLFADIILDVLAKHGIENVIGGATIDLDMKSCYQFAGTDIFTNGLVGTVFSSDKLEFNNNWSFDKSKRDKFLEVTGFLKSSSYVQEFNDKSAKKEFLDIIGISEELYYESFKNTAYASLLYLSALKAKNSDEFIPYVTLCDPLLDGCVTTIPERELNDKSVTADFFTQSGTGIQTSAYDCASKLSQDFRDISFGMFINCSNRLLIAGDKIDKENEKIKEAIGNNVPFITLYSGGEFSLVNKNPIYAAVSVHGVIAGERKVAPKNVVF